MFRSVGLIFLATALGGCASNNNAQRVQAEAVLQGESQTCSADAGKSNLEKSQCLNAAIRRTTYMYSTAKDLLDQQMALREVLSAKVDRHELTIEEARLQFAQATSGLTEQAAVRAQQQQELISQRNANFLAAMGAINQMAPKPQSVPVYQMPATQPSAQVNCTSTPMGQTVYTNCY
jgi:hypothetical protein